MPDISMCSGANCSLKEKCYRFKAIPNPHGQSYCNGEQKEDGKCDKFWDITEEGKDFYKGRIKE